jgi:hypothetical protein
VALLKGATSKNVYSAIDSIAFASRWPTERSYSPVQE